MKIIRLIIILITTAFIAWLFGSQIIALNKVRDDGQTVYLDLRPVDPRALMLGDYMRLRYTEERVPEGRDIDDLPPKGAFVMTLNENNVGSFSHLDSKAKISSNEVRFNYTRTNRSLTFGAPRFYFENGTAQTYENARYGVFKVSPAGKAILVNLADEKFKTLRPDSD
ncbi:GDYXXLXY domain-containing protein [Litorimonas haliclonae]|uniref:GDYXXLXY domain-containing protein n=1 Tax=Litorimonas haliclonae TaxID=2081977 RepID=UPI0039EFAE30